MTERDTPTPEQLESTPDSPQQLRFWKDYQFWNILGVSLAFMMLSSCVYTSSMLATSVLNDAHDEYFNGTGKEGYYSLAVTYTVMAASNWIAPSVIAYTGPKYGMFLGAIPYCLMISVFIRPFFATLYVGSALVGIGGAVLYTSQGVFLTINSEEKTMQRNSGLSWGILSTSMLWANTFVTVELADHVTIDSSLRLKIFLSLLCTAVVGDLSILLLRHPGARDAAGPQVKPNAQNTFAKKPKPSYRKWIWLNRMHSAFALIRTKNMILLCMTFAYTGLLRTFFSGVYGTSIHYTQNFGKDVNYLLGFSGVILGLGEVIAGCTFGLLGSLIARKFRVLMIAGGVGVHLICYLLIFLSLPTLSPLRLSDEKTYITPNKHLMLFCSFLLGLGDGTINTQIYSTLGIMYYADSPPAFALFKFVQCLTAAIGFFYSSTLTLPSQLGILAGSGVIGAATFAVVELRFSMYSKKELLQATIAARRKSSLPFHI